MRVAYFIRSDFESLAGGPTIQIREYAKAVEAAGGQAIMHSRLDDPPPGRFDVAHLSNLDWTLETARQFELARKCAAHIAISPIHRARSWVASFPGSRREGAARLASYLGLEAFERLRNLAWARSRPPLREEALQQLLGGAVTRQRQIIDEVDLTCLIARGEAHSIEEDLGSRPDRSCLVPNAAPGDAASASVPGLPDEFVLVVGRVEAQKGQVEVALALAELDLPGVFVGEANPRHPRYVKEFSAIVDKSNALTWLRGESHARTLALYGRASVHVLASWFEVVPLVDLEAAAAGCPVVTTTHSYSFEYLGDGATYWSPPSGVPGLRAAIADALEMGSLRPSGRLGRFDWGESTSALLAAYADLV